MEDTRKKFIEQLLSQLPQLRIYINSFNNIGIDSEDVLQEMLLRALLCKNLNNENVIAWAKTVIHNICINYYNSQRCHEQYRDMVLCEKPAEYKTLAQESLCDYDCEIVRRTVNRLPENTRIVIEMYMQGLSYKQICERLSLTMPTVKNRISTAKKILKVQLEGIW